MNENLIIGKFRMLLVSNPIEASIDFILYSEGDTGRNVAGPLTLKFIERGGYVSDPTFRLGKEEAMDFLRSVMDQAWELGVRPTGYDNDLGATKQHLEDMRSISFHKLGITKEQRR